jgi:LacI family transcriptional regulator
MPTIKDVALRAGVGVGTASRVVSGRGSVSAKTAERVKKAIADVNYKPTHAARSLLSGNSQMIGVYIPMLKGTFYTPILAAIDTELRQTGRHMVVSFGSGEGDLREQAIDGVNFLFQKGCDGLIIMSNALLDKDLVALGEHRAKVILLNHFSHSMADQCFVADHKMGGRLAAEALLSNGHKQFAVIAGPDSAPDNLERVASFLNVLKKHKIKKADIAIAKSDFSREGGYASAKALVQANQPFTALFCANDEMAVGALSYFQSIRIVVPDQISVIGYDDTESAEFSAPHLTSVHIPWREITLNSVRHLLSLCYGEVHSVQRHFPTTLTWRASVSEG